MVDISDKTSVSMPIKNMIGIIILVASFVTAFAQITSRLTSLETKDELMSADLLKKAEQTPKNLEIYMLIEMNAKSIEKLQASIESLVVALYDTDDKSAIEAKRAEVKAKYPK